MKSSLRVALFVALLAAAACRPPPETAASPFEAFAGRLEAARLEFGSPGLSAAIVIDDKLAWSQGFGMADVENEVAAGARSVYRIASISKPIAATAVMQLLEQGKVALSDPIQKYVPSFPLKPEGTVTLRSILTHSSGIRHYHEGEYEQKVSYGSIEEAIKIFRDDPLLFPPGEKYSYSSYAYNLLAGVVESVSGMSFEQYLKQRVFAPASMEASYFDHPDQIIPFRVRPYIKSGGGVLNAPFADLSIKWAGGGLLSTAGDLARFHIALDEGRLLRPETIELTYSDSVPSDEEGQRYGLGWQLWSDEHGHDWVAHSGGATGGTTHLLRNPKEKLAVVILANVQAAGPLRRVALEIAEDLLARR